MANNKEFMSRMQGMEYAYEIVKKDGIEGLEKEIKRRNITKIPMTVTQAEMRHVWDDLCQNMYNNITVTFLYALQEAYDLDQDILKDMCDEYRNAVSNVMDLDYMGEHYIKLEDYAVEIKTKMGLDIDIERIAVCQDHFDETNKKSNYHMARIEKIIDVLEKNQYLAASNFLRHKMESI